MGIVVRSRGNFKRSRKLLSFNPDKKMASLLYKYGQRGADALAAATPVNSGATAQSWTFEIAYANGSAKINWINTNVNDGVNIAVILQMGHGTGTGGWVEGRDYINPALQPIFDDIANSLWREVSNI